MRAQTALVALAMVLAVAAIPVAGMAATDTALADQHTNETDGNATEDASVAPGERLSGVVGVQEAELEGEVDERTFGIRVAQAATSEARAEVVAEQLADIEQRLSETEQRKQELREARDNGSMSEGKYRAEVAKLAAQTETAKELTNRSANASEGLPADLLESKGVNATAIQMLKDRADRLTGPEVAEIARSIAGRTAPGAGPPADRGPGNAGPSQAGGPGDGGADGERGGGGPPEDRGPAGDSEDTDGEDTATPTPDDGDGSDEGGSGGGGSY